jgi:hypothetical protein
VMSRFDVTLPVASVWQLPASDDERRGSSALAVPPVS